MTEPCGGKIGGVSVATWLGGQTTWSWPQPRPTPSAASLGALGLGFLLIVFVHLALLLGRGVLVLLVLGHQVVHVALGLVDSICVPSLDPQLLASRGGSWVATGNNALRRRVDEPRGELRVLAPPSAVTRSHVTGRAASAAAAAL